MSRIIEGYERKEGFKFEVAWKSIGIGFIVWCIIGFFFASEFYLRNYKLIKVISFWDVIQSFLWEFSFYAAFTPLLLKFGRKFSFEIQGALPRFFRNIFVHLLAGLCFSVSCFLLQYFVYGIFKGEICVDCFRIEIMLNPQYLQRGIIVYWGTILVGQAIDYFCRLTDEKLRVAQLSTQLSEAQLSALKMQIHPHFLFNTLNSIVGLIQTDKDAAEIMTRKLSDFLRTTLKNSGEMMVTLKQELSFIETYLDIEKVRFQKRLTIEFQCDENVLAAKVPNLILQPLVENSIKHGISRKKKDGKVKIAAFRDDDFLVLEVQDNGNLKNEVRDEFKAERNGVGLKNTKERLTQIYGTNRFIFALSNDEETGTLAKIKIPYQE
jgi:two-component system, LytTR family, sensor kinase